MFCGVDPAKTVWLLPRLIAICYPCVQRLFWRISQPANDLCDGLRCIIHCKCLFLLLPCVHNPFLSPCPGLCPQDRTFRCQYNSIICSSAIIGCSVRLLTLPPLFHLWKTLHRWKKECHRNDTLSDHDWYVYLWFWNMVERERAHTCTFAEILNTCFANVKDNAFHYRLRLATERATMAKTCFLDREHRARFQKALHRVRGNDKNLIAQLFVLMQMGLIFSLLQLLLFVIAIAPFCLAGGALNFVS